MSFSSLANNQAVSYGNLQDAVNNGIFTLISTIPSPSNRESTKSVVSASVSGFNPNYPPYAIKLSNELIVKGDIYNPGNFILDAQYGIRFTSMTGSVGGLPTFTYPVTGGNTTQSYNGTIGSQTITVGLAGTLFVSPAKVVLYVNGVQVDCQNITSGVQTKTLNLSVTVGSPSTIKISINGGTCSSTPTTPIFSGKTFSTVSVNRGSGQYMVAGNAYLYGNPATTTGFTAGYLYYSTNYGSSWTQSSAYGFWYSIKSSDDGKYVLASEYYGKVYLSSNYGVSFTQISFFGTKQFSKVALSGTGQFQMILTNGGTSYVWVSTDYGVNWTSVRSDIYGDFTSCAIDYSGGTFLVGGGASGYIVRSTNQGSTWTYVATSTDSSSVADININATNGWAIAAFYSNNSAYGYLWKSNDSGASWTKITGGSAQNTWIVSILNNTVSGLALYDLQTSLTSYIQSVTGAGPSFMSTVGNKLTSPSLTWRSLSNSDNGTYILAGENSGLYLSTDGGASFNAI